MREHIDGPPKSLNILKVPAAQVPPERPGPVPAAGMSLQRQQDLYRNVRQYVREACQDTTCPPPS